MENRQNLTEPAFATIFDQAEPRLDALQKKYGVTSFGMLPYESRHEIRRVIVETAAESCPTINSERLGHSAVSYLSSNYRAALRRVKSSSARVGGALEMAKGIDSAIVLAGAGLPVGPLDTAGRIVGKPSNDVDTVRALFAGHEAALVAYNVCSAPFYLLLTNCVRTMRKCVLHDPEFLEVRLLFERGRGDSLPPDPKRNFRRWLGLFEHPPGDTISGVGLSEPSANNKSIMLYAGWEIDGEPHGVPNCGYLPVPRELLRAVVTHPALSFVFWRESGVSGPRH
jgi:hypothetical protein